MSEQILEELNKTIKPICRDDEELKAVPRYVTTDKYRLKMIDFLNMAKEKGDTISADQLMLLAIKLSNEEEQD